MPVKVERDWSSLRHFKRGEFIKDPDKLSWDVILLLDEMRDAAQCPIRIHVGYDDSGHVVDSGHYAVARDFAVAVDLHFEGWSLLKQWLWAERYTWNGIGLYPHWQHPGLHVDLRRIGREHSNLGRRWWRDKDGIYKAIDKPLLRLLIETSNDI